MNEFFDNRSRNRNRIPLGYFKPRTWEESEMFEIAKELQEPYVDYLKSILDRYGIQIIRDAWEDYQDIISRGTIIRRPGSFFNSLIEKRKPGRSNSLK